MPFSRPLLVSLTIAFFGGASVAQETGSDASEPSGGTSNPSASAETDAGQPSSGGASGQAGSGQSAGSDAGDQSSASQASSDGSGAESPAADGQSGGNSTASDQNAASGQNAEAQEGSEQQAAPEQEQAEEQEALQVYFETGAAAIGATQSDVLDQAARLFREGNPYVMILSGAADTVGPADLNLDLSLARARSVADGLEARGIPVDRLQVVGRGNTELPVDTGPGVAERQNRVVEITWR